MGRLAVDRTVAIELYREPAAAHAWPTRRVASFAVRALGIVIPLVMGCGAALIANQLLPDAHGVLTVVVRTLVVIAVSMTVIALVDRSVRRFLPLATLLQLSLVFPGEAPSRWRLTVRSTNRRHVRQLVADTKENGLADDPATAAEQVMLLVAALGDHDRHTRAHSERVRMYADLIGRAMHLSKEERQKLQWGALLHDLGKLHLAANIIEKKGELDANEWILVRRHPEHGRRLLRPLVPFLGEWAEAVWNHHERWDGTGYPRGIADERIGRAAAIVAVADSFEAMTSPHGYKKAMTVAEARAELTAGAGTQFSPDAVRAFLSISIGRLRIAMGPFAALARIPFLQQAAAWPGRVGSSLNQGFASAMAGAAPTLTAGALSIGALVGTGVIDGAVAAPQADAVAAAARASVVAPDGFDEIGSQLAVGGISAAAQTTTTTAPETTTTTTTAPPPPTVAAPRPTLPPPPPPQPEPDPPPPAPTAPVTTKAPTTTVKVTTTTRPPTTTAVTPAALNVSTSANRSAPTALGSGSLKVGVNYYIFATSTKPITKVEFYNNATGTGTPARVETGAPYDYAGTGGGGNALPTVYATAGTRSITIKVFYTDGTQTAKTATFSVIP